MSLPIALSKYQYSVTEQTSPNQIISKLPYKTGLIDAITTLNTPLFSTGQYILFNSDDCVVVTYGNKNYTIVPEKNILYAENPYVPS